MKRRSIRWLMARLTALAILFGALATLSYAFGAHIAVRYLDPPLGARWDAIGFWVMEGAATALGLLIAIRAGARMIGDELVRRRSAAASLLVAAIALRWLAPACAALARLGWNGAGEALQSRMVGRFGYDAGLLLDKLLIAGVYFLKTAGFAILFGLGLFGAALAVFIASASAGAPAGAPSAGAR